MLPHPNRLTCHDEKNVEEEVRTVGATTEGLSRMDSWGQAHTSEGGQERVCVNPSNEKSGEKLL